MEVVCDADYAGNKTTGKSLSSVQIYLENHTCAVSAVWH